MELSEMKERIELRQGDIAEMEVGAIVNEANTDLILGAGVSGAIGRRGGEAIQQACDEIQSVGIGEAVATTGGELKAAYVIHAASMEIGRFAQERHIERATCNALAEADRLGVKTIALPAIGTGVAAFPVDRCARVMLGVVARHLAGGSGLERVHFVVADAETLAVFQETFERLGTPEEEPTPRPRRSRGRREGRGPRSDEQGGRGQRPMRDGGDRGQEGSRQ